MKTAIDLRTSEIFALIESIKPLLAGRSPDVQGAVLADLTAIWLAGHPPQIRSEMLEHQIQYIRVLIEANDRIMFGEAGHPSK